MTTVRTIAINIYHHLLPSPAIRKIEAYYAVKASEGRTFQTLLMLGNSPDDHSTQTLPSSEFTCDWAACGVDCVSLKDLVIHVNIHVAALPWHMYLLFDLGVLNVI